MMDLFSSLLLKKSWSSFGTFEPPTRTLSWMEILFILASSMAFDRLQVAFEQVGAELLESGIGDGGVEVDALKEGVDLDVGLGGGGQG